MAGDMLELVLRSINAPEVQKELDVALHPGEQLPDRELNELAVRIVNIASQISRPLQPGHLMLADHFLAANEYRIADTLASSDQPLSIDDLAQRTSTHPTRLAQIMRLLSAAGIFLRTPQKDTYANSRISELLRHDHPTQWHRWIALYGNEFYDMARGIPASLSVHEPRYAAQVNYDTTDDMFAYFEKQGWLARLHATLGSGAAAMADGILADYPWSDLGHRTVMDLGGGGGALIAVLLRANPNLRGAIYDRAAVIEHARKNFSRGGMYEDVGERVTDDELISGDFTVEVPSREVYVMKWCLHNWQDSEVLGILKNVRRAMIDGDESRLIVLESILADTEAGRLSRYGDINMMMTINGKERSYEEWHRLASDADFEIAKVYSLRNSWVSAIDMRPRGRRATMAPSEPRENK